MAEQSKTWLDEYTLRVMTYKSGVFTFGLKLDLIASQAMIDRINIGIKKRNLVLVN